MRDIGFRSIALGAAVGIRLLFATAAAMLIVSFVLEAAAGSSCTAPFG